MHINSSLQLLTTEEAAAHLRISERKLYELVAAGSVPCSKVTGRWLFPKTALDRWVMSGLAGGHAAAQPAAPRIVGGSHDSLLEWALRESGCGIAILPEGSEAGLRRLVRGEVMAAAIHLHRNEGDDEHTNIDVLCDTAGLHDAVLIAFVRREQGILTAPDNPLRIESLEMAVRQKARFAKRVDGSGAQLLLGALLHRLGLAFREINTQTPAHATGIEVAQSIRSGHADWGIATRAVAQSAGLHFVSLVWERFDIAMRQRDYFMPEPQILFEFLRQPEFAQQAGEAGGYDIAETNRIRFVF